MVTTYSFGHKPIYVIVIVCCAAVVLCWVSVGWQREHRRLNEQLRAHLELERTLELRAGAGDKSALRYMSAQARHSQYKQRWINVLRTYVHDEAPASAHELLEWLEVHCDSLLFDSATRTYHLPKFRSPSP